MSTFSWTPENVQILRERYKTDGPAKLSVELGTTRASVTLKARRLGLLEKRATKAFDWTPERVARLREAYANEYIEVLMAEFGVPHYVIRSKALQLGLKSVAGRIRGSRRKSESNTTHNIRYFHEWSDEMAYILGFLFADGSINKRGTDVIVGLADTDRCVLEYIKEQTKSTRPLYTKEEWTDNKGCIHRRATFLTLGSKIMVERLQQLGMHQRKTYRDDPFPNMADRYIPHFIRGYLDGDGSVCFTGNGRCSLSFVGTPAFITGLQEELVRLAGMRQHAVVIEEQKDTTCARVAWTRPADLRAFRAFAYPEGFAFCLERKKKKLDVWLAESHRENNDRPWTEAEIELMKALYNVPGGRVELIERLKRSVPAIRARARILNLHTPREKRN